MINVEHVTMKFKMANDKIISLKETVVAFLSGKLHYEEFTALEDISFEVKKGEVIGIIGKNGAGKSTLLKIISGVLKPTEGKVSVNGNIVPMLELGSGFDPELTGRENVYLNGAILGYSEAFLKEKYLDILEFSELGEFINMPIRNYSSGMMMRLAFSIATVVCPEVLIVDEILSVGDEGFQNKSKARMLELMSGGTTVLFVSHSLEQVEAMCDRVVWLDQHKVRMTGTVSEVCKAYREYWK
ncbi:ABC transporter ATP-binding protein [Lacrimispora celerecrescens]|uniref:ABC transporter ATP-binding protein n=1 Tax=Lacrimispora celerecrescens TaxID=29354 RepID=UPI001646C580|nr:ABC transporter ATP-binding protein [Lacrimispora celerecrescens]